MSGPIQGVSATRGAVAAAAVAIPAPGIALPGRRTAAPARRRKAARPSSQTRGLALRTIDAFEGVSRSAVLDRIMRGRLWIGLLAFGLVGIVAMQLVVLKLNTGVGTTLTRQALLERDNAQLNVENSMASGENRVAPLAASSGMTLAPAGSVHFLQAGAAYVSHAVKALSGAVQVPAPGSTSASSTQSSGEASVEASTGSEASGEASSTAGGEEASSTGESEASASEGSSSPPTSEASSPGTDESSSAEGTSEAGSSSESPAASSESSTPTAVSGPGGGTQAGTQE
jgi:hypothetical protein